MKLSIKTLDNKDAGSIEVSDDVFGLPARPDILARMVRWQLAKRRAGTHDTKEIGEISGGGKKPRPQKGSGRSRQGSTRSPQWRHGAVIFGPTPRTVKADIATVADSNVNDVCLNLLQKIFTTHPTLEAETVERLSA